MCKFWMSACTTCMFVMMTIGSASAHGYVNGQMRLLGESKIQALSVDGLLEKRVLQENKLELSQNVQPLNYDLQRLEPCCLKSNTGFEQLSLKRWGFQENLDIQRLSGLNEIELIGAQKLQSSIPGIKARSLPGSGIWLGIHGGVLGRL